MTALAEPRAPQLRPRRIRPEVFVATSVLVGVPLLIHGSLRHNAASARVLEKAGYLFEGRLRMSVTKDGQTIDQLMYAFTRD